MIQARALPKPLVNVLSLQHVMSDLEHAGPQTVPGWYLLPTERWLEDCEVSVLETA